VVIAAKVGAERRYTLFKVPTTKAFPLDPIVAPNKPPLAAMLIGDVNVAPVILKNK
jgi:hypothetical protein